MSRKKDYPAVSFDGSSEKWTVLGAGLFEGKIRAVVSTLDGRSRGVTTEKVVIKPGQMKLFYVLDGTVALHYNGERHSARVRRQRPARRRAAARLGESRHPEGPGALGDPGLGASVMAEGGERVQVDFRTEPSRYKHWQLSLDGRVATLAMDVREDGGLRPGYELKLNSYDLGVDIELYDAVQRLRFEHPEVGAVDPPARPRSASSAPAPTSACWASPRTAGR